MSVVAAVPVQRLASAKSRLAARLSPEERRALVLAMLEHVLGEIARAPLVDDAFLVSPDPEVLRFAEARGVAGLVQRSVGLNEAVRQARERAMALGAESLLIVLPDLPLITAADFDALVAAAPDRGIVVAPDRHQQGTNALLLSPPDVIEPFFGPGSLRLHRAAALERGVEVRELRSLGAGFDLDTPADLDELARLTLPSGALGGAPRGREALR